MVSALPTTLKRLELDGMQGALNLIRKDCGICCIFYLFWLRFRVVPMP